MIAKKNHRSLKEQISSTSAHQKPHESLFLSEKAKIFKRIQVEHRALPHTGSSGALQHLLGSHTHGSHLRNPFTAQEIVPLAAARLCPTILLFSYHLMCRVWFLSSCNKNYFIILSHSLLPSYLQCSLTRFYTTTSGITAILVTSILVTITAFTRCFYLFSICQSPYSFHVSST